MPAIAPDCCLKTILGKYLVLTDAPFFIFMKYYFMSEKLY